MARALVDAALPGLTPVEQELVERAVALGRGALAENATAIDRGTLSVHGNLAALASAGLAGINVPRAFGGSEVGRPTFLRVLEALAYGDGTTSFVIAQHYGTALMLAHSPNEVLRRSVLPRMATGELLTGFGVTHVRRAGKPVLTAVPHGDGYRLDGSIPWLTGYGIFSHVVVAATLPDGGALLAWVPFEESACLRFSAPMELVAMNMAQTVSATVQGLVVRPGELVSLEPSAQRVRSSAPPIPCLYGLAHACLDDMAMLAQWRNAPLVARAAERLARRLHAQRPRFYDLAARLEEADSATPLAHLRAAATCLALDAAGALIVATGGGANAVTSAAQRRLRETSVFATWGPSSEAVDATISVLSDQP